MKKTTAFNKNPNENKLFLQTYLHTFANYWACRDLQDQAIYPEVAEGVLDEVGLQHLNPMSLKDEKMK